jgi:single-strand DNA-binding protein
MEGGHFLSLRSLIFFARQAVKIGLKPNLGTKHFPNLPLWSTPMINKVTLIGNLGQDPDMRSTASGTAVANLRIATTERRKDRDGNWNDHTEWHSVVSFGRTAENVGKYCRKGKQIYIEGRLQTRKWQDRDGRDRYSTEVVADNIRFLGGGGGASQGQSRGNYGGNDQNAGWNQNQPSASAPTQAPTQAPAAANTPMPYADDEEIPF